MTQDSTEEALREIMRALGRLEQGQDRQRGDFESEKLATRESRLRSYTQLEKIEEDVGIVGKVAAQARDEASTARSEAAAVKKLVDDDVKPVTDEIKQMKLRGIGALWAIGILATAFGFSVATFGEGIIAAIRAWLKIA